LIFVGGGEEVEEKINALEQQVRKHDEQIKTITIAVLLLIVIIFFISIILGRTINNLERVVNIIENYF